MIRALLRRACYRLVILTYILAVSAARLGWNHQISERG